MQVKVAMIQLQDLTHYHRNMVKVAMIQLHTGLFWQGRKRICGVCGDLRAEVCVSVPFLVVRARRSVGGDPTPTQHTHTHTHTHTHAPACLAPRVGVRASGASRRSPRNACVWTVSRWTKAQTYSLRSQPRNSPMAWQLHPTCQHPVRKRTLVRRCVETKRYIPSRAGPSPRRGNKKEGAHRPEITVNRGITDGYASTTETESFQKSPFPYGASFRAANARNCGQFAVS